MSDRKLHTKTVYILAWVILVCAGILIRTGIADDVWKLVYRGIYGSSSGDAGGSIYSPGAAEPDVYCYMDYWESQVREVSRYDLMVCPGMSDIRSIFILRNPASLAMSNAARNWS